MNANSPREILGLFVLRWGGSSRRFRRAKFGHLIRLALRQSTFSRWRRLTKNAPPRGVTVCSHNTIVGTVRPLLQSNRTVQKRTITATKTAGDEPPPYDVKIKFRAETGRRGRRPLRQRKRKPHGYAQNSPFSQNR